MSWTAPSFLLWGGVALVALTALHLLARRRPPAEDLPTARFVPSRTVRVTSRGMAPSDILLFVVRALALVAIASAFAAPLVRRARAREQRIVLVDESRAVASVAELRESVRAVMRDGDILVSFDSAARVHARALADSIAITDVRGSYTSALVTAARSAASLTGTSDSLDLVIVSPFLAEEVDDATLLARDAWPGRARLVRVRARDADTVTHALDVEPGDDALRAPMRLLGTRATAASVRVRRSRPSAGDSAWARESGHVLVHWPRSSDTSTSGWSRRQHADTVGGVSAGEALVVAPLLRAWTFREDARVVARWVDGEPAATEHAAGGGCIRDVGIDVEPSSDAPLRPEFRRLTTALLSPCGRGAAYDPRALHDTVVARLTGAGRLASTDDFRATTHARSPWTLWLLAAALGLLALEWLARRERRGVGS